MWRFTVKKSSHGCRKLQFYHVVLGFCVFAGSLAMLQCEEIVNVVLLHTHPRRRYRANRRHNQDSRNAHIKACELSLHDCGVPEADRIRRESSQAKIQRQRLQLYASVKSNCTQPPPPRPLTHAVNFCLCNKDTLIKERQNHSPFLLFHCYLPCQIVRGQKKCVKKVCKAICSK